MSQIIETENLPLRKRNAKILSLIMAIAGLTLVIVAAALIFLIKSSSANTGEASDFISAVPLEMDFAAPEVKLNDLKGAPVSLADFRGQTVLVNHWAFWCPPCRDELPTLEKYYKDHRNQKFTIVAIESGGEFEDVDYFARQFKLTFPVWMDPGEKAASAFNVVALPSSFIIDPAGQVIMGWSGEISREMLEKHITPILEK